MERERTNLVQGLEVSIEQEICCGSGMCESIAPQLFRVGLDGLAAVAGDASGVDRALVVRAARSCPTLCISIHENGQEISLY